MDKNNQKKKDQLGVDPGTASNKLKKAVLYHLAKRLNEHYCFQCRQEIESIEEFTIEHKVPWLDSDNPTKLFFSMDNIAFSHSYCNVGAARRVLGKCPSSSAYAKGCRCEKCIIMHREVTKRNMKKLRARKKS